MRIRFQVSGKSKFARLFAKTGVPVNFDVRWVLHPSHWTVNAVKVANDSKVADYRSRVWFASRTMILFSLAVRPYTAGNAAGVAVPGFETFPHEFGHSINAPDEYSKGSPNLKDAGSIMNIGHSIRGRHPALIVRTLNDMISDTTFRL